MIFSGPLRVSQLCKRHPHLKMKYELGTICSLIDQALTELHQSKPRGSNPYEGQCYIASATLKKFFGRALMLYRTKDHTNQYHWWVETKDGQVIDLTRKQYELIGVSVPSTDEAAIFKEKQSYLSFASYKKRVAELQSLVEQKLAKIV
jgi:hypothetical protein